MVRCGLVGCGQVAAEMHVPALRAIPRVELIAVCDADQERARAFAAEHGCRHVFGPFDRFLHLARDLDLVIVATPGFTHYELAKAVLDAGVNVLVEKPIALRAQQACELAGLARARGVQACVAQTWRYREPVMRAFEAWHAGLIGRIDQVKATHHGGSLFHVSEPRWSWNDAVARPLLYEHAIHLLDLQACFAGPARCLIGGRTVKDPHLDAVTEVHALVEHEGGAIGHVDLRAFSSSNYTHFEIFGTANDVTIKFFPHSYRLYSGRLNPVDELMEEIIRVRDFAVPVLTSRFRRQPVPRRALPHYRLIRAFVEALESGGPSPVSIESVLPAMHLLDRLGKEIYG